MTKYLLTISFSLIMLALQAQLAVTPTGDSGSGYPAILAAGLDIETPDCEHTDFGPHVTQVYDAELNRNTFAFHSHIEADNDRCLVFDRVRMEIKGGPGTDAEAQHLEGDTSYYRWKFRLASDFVGASSFCHLFQNKAKGGADDGLPVLTITARQTLVELRHSGGDTGTSLGRLTSADLSQFRGRWVEVYVMQVHRETGTLAVSIKDMATGQTILEYTNTNIDLWRTGADYSRPKWGIYRARTASLQDEIVHFADFCISETAAELCPAEAVLITDTTPPTAPTNLVLTNTMISSVALRWEAATDDFGVIAYEVLQDGELVLTTPELEVTVTGLMGGTTYSFTVRARDEAGNTSENSNVVSTTTDPANTLPDLPGNPFPLDGAVDISSEITLRWNAGNNTTSYRVLLGVEPTPTFGVTQTETTYSTTLLENTTYYWQVIAINDNGETAGPVWGFTTGGRDPDFPWKVYRADARMEVETNFWRLESEPATPLVNELLTDPIVNTNSFYAYRYDGDEKFRWRTDLNEEDSTITIVARLMPQSPEVNGMCHFEIRAAGWRQKVRLNDGNIKLEVTSPIVERDLNFDWDDQLHVIRIVVAGPQTTIYLDEDPEPFLTGRSNEEASFSYFDWGKGGASDYGSLIDWLAFDPTGAYAPYEGEALPADLIRSNDACLSTLTINGEQVNGFSPDLLQYEVNIAIFEQLPNVSWQTRSRFATSELNNPSNPEGTQGAITVTADDGVSTKTYTLNYLVVNIEEQELVDWLKVFPNPASDYLQVALPAGARATATLFNREGQVVRSGLQIETQANWDVSGLPAGTYLLRVARSDDRLQYYKLIIQ